MQCAAPCATAEVLNSKMMRTSLSWCSVLHMKRQQSTLNVRKIGAPISPALTFTMLQVFTISAWTQAVDLKAKLAGLDKLRNLSTIVHA